MVPTSGDFLEVNKLGFSPGCESLCISGQCQVDMVLLKSPLLTNAGDRCHNVRPAIQNSVLLSSSPPDFQVPKETVGGNNKILAVVTSWNSCPW